MKPSRDLLGQRFGKLVVVEFLGLRSNGHQQVAWWKCLCDCGNVCEVQARWLLSKTPRTHCGCVKPKGRPKALPTYDLSGQVFNELTVLSFAGRDKIGNYIWNCKCSCGELCTASTVSLQRGNKKSCGHLYSVKNKIYMVGDTGICLINNGKDYFWFDAADIVIVENNQWCAAPDGYAYTHYRANGVDTTYRFIRKLFDLPPSSRFPIIDHINGDVCDNRRSNLRVCTNAENVRHRHGVKGWYTDKKSGRFFSRIRINGKIIHLGMFDTKEQARAAYLAASEKYHGSFGTYKKIVWYPGWDNDNILNFKNMKNWVDFLHTQFCRDVA